MPAQGRYSVDTAVCRYCARCAADTVAVADDGRTARAAAAGGNLALGDHLKGCLSPQSSSFIGTTTSGDKKP